MAASSEETRQRILAAALVEFAAEGIHHASLLEITRRAGQRNRGAVHYHFGSREGLLAAVLESEAPALATRERELLEVARSRPDDDLRSALEAVARPILELAETGTRGASYLRIVQELVSQGARSLPPDIEAALAHTGGTDVYALISERLPIEGDDIRFERLTLTTTFMLQAITDRARGRAQPAGDAAGDDEPPGRPRLPTEAFLANLLDMVTAMLSAPTSATDAASA